MGPVYATRLTILPDDDHPAELLHDHAVEVCYRWLVTVGERFSIDVPPLSDDDIRLSCSVTACTITSEHVRQNGDCGWRAVITHPYSPHWVEDRNLQLRVEIQARDAQGEEVVTVRILLGSLVDHIKPLGYYLKPPRVISDILTEFDDVFIGNVHATLHPRHLTESEVPAFVHNVILRQDRFAPVIVVSRTEDELFLCDPDKLAREIAGLGRVYTLPSHASGFALSDGLDGKRLSCYNGAVRLYWPDCAISDHPQTHPLWLADRLEDEELATRLPGRLFGMIASASSLGITSDTRVWELYRTANDARTQAIIDRAKELADTKVAATEADYYDAVHQMDAIQEQCDQLSAHTFQLELTIQEIRKNIDETHSGTVDLVRRALSCRTLLGVVELVQELSDDRYLLFLPEALESAKSAPYQGSMTSVLEMLLRIRAVASRYHHQMGPEASFEEMFKAEGEPDFRGHLSKTSRKSYSSDYERTIIVEGKPTTFLCDNHIRNGGGAPKNSVSVYWYPDPKTKRFLIGHVGRHLRGSQDT